MIADAKTKVYGDADPSLTYQVSGLKNGDSAGSILTGGLNRAAGENVGVYGINQGDLALNSGNYDLSYQGNNLTITKALLNVIADAKTKVYGDGLLGQQHAPHVAVVHQAVGDLVGFLGPGERAHGAAFAGVGEGALVGQLGGGHALDGGADAGAVHEGEHAFQALVRRPDEEAGGAVEVHHAGGRGLDPHLQGFASAGGHSLLGVQAIAELRRLTGRQLSLGLLQGDPDAREVVRRCHVADAPPLPPATERARALWLQRSGSAQPRLRLIALPPAGGNAGTFRGGRP